MAKPFLKWAGGKTQLLDTILARRPADYQRYVELMLGGGAVTFALAPANALINDSNQEIIQTYEQVKANPAAVISYFGEWAQNSEVFYQVRAADRADEIHSWEPAKRAARTIYLNKLGYNGLYRVNKAGQFNAPYGKRSGIIFDSEIIWAASRVLANCTIKNQPYHTLSEELVPGDWVYMDPPYPPISETSNFTQYTADGFSWNDHLQLKLFCDSLDERGIKFLLSSSHTTANLELYSNYNISVIFARRSINSKADRRGRIPEILVSNY